uniref:Uncharacterized protein n=1 Tax=Romanomermis culicivorax TaxID=13658 RepID=A0A915HFE3_ROMCU
YWVFSCHSGFGDSVVDFAATTAEICDAGQGKPVNDTENDWQPQRTTAPLARVIAQGPPPGIPMDSVLEVVGQMESMNLLELLRAINNAINVTEAWPFPTATVPRSPKIGVLREVHPCGGLVIDFPGEDPVLSDDDDVEE